MNIDSSIKFKNNYRLQHIDTITGETLHDLEFHNVVLDQIIDTVVDVNSADAHMGFGIAIGSGSGTPSASDTQLFNEIKRFVGNRGGVTGKCSKKDNNTLLFSVSVTIPANASEVYDISEVGVCFYVMNTGMKLVTHALILDSEGNPITIKKKDTDKIILNCELYITFESEDIENFNVDTFVRNSTYIGTLVMQYIFGAATSLETEKVSDAHYNNTHRCDIYVNCPSTYNLPRPSWEKDKNAKTLTVNFGPSRLPEFSMPTYIRGITFGKLGTIKLPNEAIFPRYKVSNITVGIGDGKTTKFKCPLNYFIQDSEIIRVGNDEKTRNTDYTIDNEANQDELIELSAGNEAIISGGLSEYASHLPLFRKPFGKITRSYDYISGRFGPGRFDASNPLYLDFKEPVKLNTLRVPLSSSGTFTLFGRDTEEEDWTLIGQFTPNNENNHYNFDLCYYRYIKLTSTKSAPYVPDRDLNNGGYNMEYDTIEKCKEKCYFIGYVGDGIEFTTPPPEGAVITMDAYTDLPFVSSNNVLDLSATLTFHF